jgi:hypothetical protein
MLWWAIDHGRVSAKTRHAKYPVSWIENAGITSNVSDHPCELKARTKWIGSLCCGIEAESDTHISEVDAACLDVDLDISRLRVIYG